MRALLLCAAALVLTPLVLAAYTANPMPNRTGGFGGPTCHVCHDDNALNLAGGELSVEGMPDRYTPGETYRLTVQLKRANLERAGFSMAARFASGAQARRQAGEWLVAGERIAFYPDAQTGVRYVQQSSKGTGTRTVGTIAWEFDWKAPAEGEPVQFNVAANAANNDRSPRGDIVYVREITVPARSAQADRANPAAPAAPVVR